MRKNQIILDEAARSVRRAFVGSVAGSVTMLGVVGVAGAYGMPERLSAHSLSTALTSLQLKLTPMVDAAQPAVDRATVVAGKFKRRMQPVEIESDDEVVLQVPRVLLASAGPVRTVEPSRIEALAKPVSAPVAPPADVIAMPEAPLIVPLAEKPATVPAEKSVAVPVEKPEPAPTVTAALSVANSEPVKSEPVMPAPLRPARAMPGAMPDVASQPMSIPAPLVFEQPELDKIQPLTELPKIEIVEQPKPGETPKTPEPQKAAPFAEKPAEGPAMAAMASATGTVDAEEYPKPVMVYLPVAKPPMSPAQLLNLHDADYDKAERCLAQAIYFEARAEPVRGQQAVAQVVLNRVFSPYYPKDVCSVVYQNAHRHLSCQFTFACDGKPEAIRERGAWARANRIAKQALDAKVWLPEVAKATHYHATYVKPDWIRDMKMLVKTGVHIFYRPRNWGDGSKEAQWGTPTAAAAAAPLPAPVHKKGVKS